jgi:hypothetical protein
MLNLNLLQSINLPALVQQFIMLEDPQVLPHLSNVLALIQKTKAPEDIMHLSNLVKQTEPRTHHHKKQLQEAFVSVPQPTKEKESKEYTIRKFSLESQKLQWAGYSLSKEEAALVDGHLLDIAEKYKVSEIRFWGKIFGTEFDYYVIQGVAGEIKALEEIVKGGEKRGEGVNYHTFWVTNNLIEAEWIELPLITPEHIKTARKIKKYFSGRLEKPLSCEPLFNGVEKYYLKAQLVRMTSSLEIVPKGIFKPNDDNPKLVEYEEEPKVPEFAELSTL